jgi:Ni/Fe-hydrogenase subunit HybB-like protein
VVFNRFNVTMTAFSGYREFTYFPSIGEIAVTVGFVVLGILVFDLGARNLPVYGAQPAGDPPPR